MARLRPSSICGSLYSRVRGGGAMWQDFITSALRALVLLALSALSIVQVASAQTRDDDPKSIRGTFASRYTRYYAPYALQASAAYVDVDLFNKLLGPAGEPNQAGADVALALQGIEGSDRARRYLESWQFQFGSTGYLTCYEANADCLQSIGNDKRTVAISGGPTFHVWARKAGRTCSEISIVFRGSTLSLADWLSNLDVASGWVVDNEYRQLRRNIDGIIGKIASLECVRRANGKMQIVSVGHSLGGGLAQLAALANNPRRKRIAKVFAFDPSPVTGASYVEKSVYDTNVAGLEIDRIYQIGEVLQPLRGFVQEKPKVSAPCVREVRFDFIPQSGLTGRHNMARLASDLASFAEGSEQKFVAPPSMPSCAARYVRPVTDEPAPASSAPGIQDIAAGPDAIAPGRGAAVDRTMMAYAPSGASPVLSPGSRPYPAKAFRTGRPTAAVKAGARAAMSSGVDVATGAGGASSF